MPSRVVLLAAAIASLVLPARAARADDIAVVVHPEVPIDSLSVPELRKIMLGDRQFWPGGERVTLLVRAPIARERTVLLEKVFEMSEARFRQYWVAKVFRAEVTQGPRVVVSNEQVVEFVGVMQGAIALVSEQDVPDGLKILKIDGALPGAEGYPLR